MNRSDSASPLPTQESSRRFRQRANRALADAELSGALRRTLNGLRQRRSQALAEIDFGSARADLKQRRTSNREARPLLLDRFRQNLEAAGGKVHLAADATEANQIISDICREHSARLVTKSKSMASEEIGLREHLEHLGLEVVETDRGERLVQLYGGRPSHLIAPAIHLTRRDAAHLLGTADDLDAIMAEARTSLREKFIAADVGITGANIAIAETGTVVLVTNEGNADLTTTLPPVHIALLGIDKLVDSMEDAVAILRLLSKSATGQTMTSYVNWITGPSRSADIEQSLTIGVHGPREMHAVILDNGRTEMAADPVFSEALNCIRCGACSNVCPAFMAVGGHSFGHIYTGPIGIVVTPFHHGLDNAKMPASLCLQCNACQDACPADIPLPRQILEVRRRAAKPLAKEMALQIWSRPQVASPLLGAAAALGVRPLARHHLQATPSAQTDGDPIVIMSSCLVDRVMPGVGKALAQIMEAAGYRPAYTPGQWCCGLVCANAGDFELGAKLAGQMASALSRSRAPIVTPSTSCFGAMTQDAADWAPGMAEVLAPVSSRLQNTTTWLLQLLSERPSLVQQPSSNVPLIAYHDSCQSLRSLHLHNEPRRVLELAGYTVVDIGNQADCCGFGGSFSAEWPKVSRRIGGWKLDAFAETGAAILASDNPGCLTHLHEASLRRQRPVRTAHIVELVAARLRSGPAN